MSILNVKNLSHGFGDRAIFNDVSFRLLKGEHIGLFGANGEGKSTFMNIVTGKLEPDAGIVEWSKRVRAGYLDQHAVLEKGMTIRDVLRSAFQYLYDIEAEMNQIFDKMAEATTEDLDQLLEDSGTIQDILNHNDFYIIDSKVEETARGLGLVDLGLDKDVLGAAYTESPFYGMPLVTGLGSNPLIGRISTQKTIGGIGGFPPGGTSYPITFKNTTLNVYETAPTRSEIDIFYETSSSGLISELNTDIEFGDVGFVPVEISNWSFKLDEGVVGGQILNVPNTAPFTVKNYQGVDLQGIVGVTVTAKLVSVFSGNNASINITNRNLFEIIPNVINGGWFIKASANPDFVYTAQSAAYDKYKFTIEFTVVDTTGALPITTKNNITVNASKSVLKNLPVRSLDGDNSVVNNPGRTVFNIFMNSNINLGSKVLPTTQDTSWGIKTFQLPNSAAVDGFIDVMTFNFSNGSTSEGRNKNGLTLRIKEVLVKLPQLNAAYPYFLDTRRSPSDYARLVSPVEGLARFPEKLQINPLYVRVFDPTVTSLEKRSEYVTQGGQQVLVEYPGLYTPQTNTQSPGVYTEYLITMEVFDASFQSSASVPPTYIPGVGSTNIANFSVTLRVNNP